MYENPILQDNLKKLADYGKLIVEPASGMLACRDIGKGKMPEPEVLFAHIMRLIAKEKDLAGKKVLVTAGPTQEAIDPVRYITNHSTGKMGYAIAENAMLRGADVTLISGPCAIEPPIAVRMIPVISAGDMYEAVMAERENADIIIMTAAVADYRPAEVSTEKIKKKEGRSVDSAGPDAGHSGNRRPDKKERPVCVWIFHGNQHMLENSRAKIQKKHPGYDRGE